MPPHPPLQVDWVILQRFVSLEDARRWLGSSERQSRIEGATPMLVGRDDVHIVRDDASAARAAPVSAVMSTRVKPGMEAEYLKWEQKVAAAQSKAAGLQGYRFEPAVPGVQEDFIAILRFDSETNLQAWLESPQRRQLLDEAAPLTAEFHTRMAQSGFEQWFRDATPEGAPAPAAWKMNMIVLLTLYPVVFLWGLLVGTPILTGILKLNFPVALFIGNAFSVILTSYLVPWTANRLLKNILGGTIDEEWRDPTGQVVMLHVILAEGWVGQKLSAFEESTGARVALISRFGKGELPAVHSVIQAGDELHVTATDDLTDVVRTAAATGPAGGHH